jgi:hypothetical protein
MLIPACLANVILLLNLRKLTVCINHMFIFMETNKMSVNKLHLTETVLSMLSFTSRLEQTEFWFPQVSVQKTHRYLRVHRAVDLNYSKILLKYATTITGDGKLQFMRIRILLHRLYEQDRDRYNVPSQNKAQPSFRQLKSCILLKKHLYSFFKQHSQEIYNK